MATDNDNKRAAQRDLLRDLRDLHSVLAAEAQQAIPVLHDVVEAPAATKRGDAANSCTSGSDPSDCAGGSTVARSASMDTPLPHRSIKPVERGRDDGPAPDQEQVKPSPFELVGGRAADYDTSTAESLVDDGLAQALQSLTSAMDDEALRLVEELIAKHAEIIRQELTVKLKEKNRELRAELIAHQAGDGQ